MLAIMKHAEGASVIIPAYRATPFIERAIRSVRAQNDDRWEVVIGSDDLVDYSALPCASDLRDAGRLRCVSTGNVGTGAANARNVALDAARSRVIVSLDADDQLAPGALSTLVPLVHEFGAAFSARSVVDHESSERLASFDRRMPSGSLDLESVLTSQVHTYAGVAFDRERVPVRWTARRELWEDTHLFVQCFDHVERMGYTDDELYLYFKRDGSICNRPETSREFWTAARTLVERLAAGDPLELRSIDSRRTFERFLRGRMLVEERFVEAVARGECRDFREFISSRPELFYTLP